VEESQSMPGSLSPAAEVASAVVERHGGGLFRGLRGPPGAVREIQSCRSLIGTGPRKLAANLA
jgi:hypothetical protein